MMEKETLKALFSFSRRERIGILMLLICVAIAFLWPCFLSSPVMESDTELAEKLAKELAAGADSAGRVQEDEGSSEGEGHGRMRKGYEYPERRWERRAYDGDRAPPANMQLFYFDPNTIAAEGWKKLGLKERTIGTIMHYVSRGGKFRKGEDLKKIYGLSAELYERLAPFVKIPAAASDSAYKSGLRHAWNGDGTDKGSPVASIASVRRMSDPVNLAIDINTADSAAWEALPGIGGRLAQRILRFRERLGGFYSTDQLMDVYGIADSVFRDLVPYLRCASANLKKMDINTADAKELKQHPYMSWNMANAIVQYRRQHGQFHSPDDLLRIAVGDTAMLRKLLPYVKVN